MIKLMKTHLALALTIAAMINPVAAMFMRPKPIPVDRLLKSSDGLSM
jgi:hypothetical protein